MAGAHKQVIRLKALCAAFCCINPFRSCRRPGLRHCCSWLASALQAVIRPKHMDPDNAPARIALRPRFPDSRHVDSKSAHLHALAGQRSARRRSA